jgi:hypothetical protein
MVHVRPTSNSDPIEHRCQCGLLLCIGKDGWLHTKYKKHKSSARSELRVHCPRCGRVTHFCASDKPEPAA